MTKWTERLNAAVERSYVGKYFKLAERKTSFTQEIRGGTVTFLTMAYILAVNAGIIGETAGPCIADGQCPNGPGSIGDPICDTCVAEVKRSLISATAASCVIAHFLMGVLGNMPLGIAPGMGLNAYFAFTVVGYYGTGRVPYKMAVTAVFIEGFIFIALALLGVRGKLVQLVPQSIWLATAAGIGLFLAFIGFQAGNGLGLVTYDPAVLVALGGCTPEYRVESYQWTDDTISSACTIDNGVAVPDYTQAGWTPSGTYACMSGGVLRDPTMWLGIMGGMFMCILMKQNVKGSIIYGIVFVTVISWIPTSSNKAAYLGATSSIPGGEARLEYFKKVVTAPNISKTAAQFDWTGFGNGEFWIALITFLYIDLLDTTGTLFTMANFLGLYLPGFIEKKTKKFERQTLCFTVDGASISIGATMGTSSLTAYIESASGIREGARTGLAALTLSFYFFLALFFTPLLASIPPYATGPALILVGTMMLVNVTKIDWLDVNEAVPAFITLILMPLCYNIAYSVIGGILTWIFLNGASYLINLAKAKLCPGCVPSDTKGAGGVWKQARMMTFKLPKDDDEEEEVAVQEGKAGGSSDGASEEHKDLSTHSHVLPPVAAV